MKDKLQESIDRLKDFLKQDKKRTRIIIAVLVLVILAAVILAVVLNNRPYEVLLTGLTVDEQTEVVNLLSEYGATDYRIRGDSILVPRQNEASLKAQLLLDGYPKSGFGYDTYLDNVGMTTTDSDRERITTFQLQERMSAVIRSLEGVRDATVTITEGEDRRYVLDDSNIVNPSASVIVTMQDGGPLPENYATAIQLLVSRSVKGLQFESIGISDSLGNTYDGYALTGVSLTASQLKLRLENQVNNRIRNEVLKALTPVYGEDNVRVSVNSTVDVNRRVQENTIYNTPEDAPAGEGIIGSREWDRELARGTDEGVGGVVGVQDNADIETYMENAGAVNGNENYIRSSGAEEHKVNTSTEQVDVTSGTVTDVMIAVTINQDVAGGTVPQLIDHIARAAGIQPEVQEDKISVWIAPFYNPNEGVTNLPGGFGIRRWVLIAALIGLALLFLVLLIIYLIARRRKKKRLIEEAILAAEEAEQGMGEALPGEAGEGEADVLNIQNEGSMKLKQDIRKFTQNNPEIAAQMLKSWLKEDAKNNG